MTFPEGRLGEPVRTFEGRTGARGAPVWPALVPPALVSLALIPPAIVYLRDGVWWAGVPALLLSMGCAAAAGWIAGRDRPRTGAKVVHLYTNGISVAGPDAVEFLERKQVLARQEGHVLRHAVGAPEVAPVGDGHPKIGDMPAERVDQLRIRHKAPGVLAHP